jgi:hypothetical protein
VKVRRNLGAFVGRSLNEASRSVEALRLDHESTRVQADDIRAQANRAIDQLVEHSGANVQRARLGNDIHPFDLSRSVGKPAKRPHAHGTARPVREQEHARRASVGAHTRRYLRGIGRPFVDTVFLAKSVVRPREVRRHECGSGRFISFRPRFPNRSFEDAHSARVLRLTRPSHKRRAARAGRSARSSFSAPRMGPTRRSRGS